MTKNLPLGRFFYGSYKMQYYQKLQKLYALPEIKEHCVDIDFAYAFICAMASSEIELAQWMPLLFVSEETQFSNEGLANDYAKVILAIYEHCIDCFQQGLPLLLTADNSKSSYNEAVLQYSKGYLEALMLIDNAQGLRFVEGSAEANLQQTCLLLLDKLVSSETQDVQKLALFEQLPNHNEIIQLLPTLLSRYSLQCLPVENQ